MTTWFTSDPHFGHKFMANYRDFPDVPTHDEFLVDAWNSRVQKHDEVWVLGDFSFHNQLVVDDFFHRLNGVKNLVIGNHDAAKVVDLPWASKHHLVQRSFEGQKFVMCHYPMLTWQNAHRGVLHLHGHTHGNLQAPESTRMDVGVDLHPEFAPFSLEEVMSILGEREYDFVDHHDRGESFKAGTGWEKK